MASQQRYFLKHDDRIPSRWANAYQRGAVVNGAQTVAAGGSLTVHAGHSFTTDDRALYALTRKNVSMTTVETVSAAAATTLTLTVGSSFPDGSLLVNIGADTGGILQEDGLYSSPEWDGSTTTIYEDPNGASALSNSRVDCDTGGEVAYWAGGEQHWILLRNAAGAPTAVYPDVGGSGIGRFDESVEIGDSSADADSTIVFQRTSGDKTLTWDESLSSLLFGGWLGVIGDQSQSMRLEYKNAILDLTAANPTTSVSSLIPEGSILLGLVWRITTTISGGGVTSFDIGHPGDDNLFVDDETTLTADTTGMSFAHWQVAHTGGTMDDVLTYVGTNRKIRVTCDAAPTAGLIRVGTFYLRMTDFAS